jgi:hypothetical protein
VPVMARLRTMRWLYGLAVLLTLLMAALAQ